MSALARCQLLMDDDKTPIEYVPYVSFQRHVRREERFYAVLVVLLTLILILEGAILWQH